MLRIAVFVSGGGTNLKAIIDSIENGTIQNAKIELVVSDRAEAYALTRAKDNGINTKVIAKKEFDSSQEFGHALLECMLENKIDLIVLAGYLAIVPSKLIKHYTNRIINVHPSLIPAFCGKGFYGLKVHEAVLHRGVKLTGATVHFVDEGTDTGPIILQQAVEVYDNDTKEALQKRVMEEAEWNILPRAIHLIANNKIEVIENKVKFI
jgi:phosphoribosylglycinamide formyltransferase-1